MNCKPGDLAIIIAGCPDGDADIGQIVEVLRPWRDCASWSIKKVSGQPFILDGRPFLVVGEYDSNLRPIRDQDGEDEMLRIAGKPENVSA